MIGGVTTGSSFKGLMDYLLKKGKGKTIDSKDVPKNGTPNQIAKSFQETAKKNTRTKKPVKHIFLSFHPKDGKVNKKTKNKIAKEVVKHLGYWNNQYVVVEHPRKKDHNYDHIHIVINMIDRDGERVKDSFDKKKLEKKIRSIEKKYSLTQVASSRPRTMNIDGEEIDIKHYSRLKRKTYIKIQKDIKKKKISHEVKQEIGRAELTAAVDATTEDKPKLSVFLARLKHLGIEPELYITPEKRCKISYYFPKYQKRNGEPYKYNRGIQNGSIDKLEKIREVDFGNNRYQNVKNIIDRGIPKIDKSQLIEWKDIDKHKYLMKDIKELLKEKGLDRSGVRSIDNSVSSIDHSNTNSEPISQVLIDNSELPINSINTIDNHKTNSEPISEVSIDNHELEELTKQFLHIKFNKRIKSKFFFKGTTEFQNNTYLIEATREHFLDRKDDLTELNLKISKQLEQLENILTASASFENGETDIEMVSNLTNEEIEFLKNIVVELQNEHSNVVNRIEEVEDRSIDKKESNFEIE